MHASLIMNDTNKDNFHAQACPHNVQHFTSSINTRDWGQSVSKATSIPFIVHDARDVSTWNRNYYCLALPPSVYPLSTWCDRMRPNLPGLPSPYLHNASDQVLEVWERGYNLLCAMWDPIASFPGSPISFSLLAVYIIKEQTCMIWPSHVILYSVTGTIPVYVVRETVVQIKVIHFPNHLDFPPTFQGWASWSVNTCIASNWYQVLAATVAHVQWIRVVSNQETWQSCAYNQLIWRGICHSSIFTRSVQVYQQLKSLSAPGCFTTALHNQRKDFIQVSNVSPTLLHTHCAPKGNSLD